MKKNIIKLEDYEKILDIEITPNQHFLLGVIDSKNKELFLRYTKIEREDKLKNDLYLLWTKGLIEGFDEKNYLINFDNLVVNTSTIKVSIPSDDPFYIECLELFPKIKVNNYPIRSDKKDFIKKLQRFEKEYPEYNRELIKKAFETYVEDFRKKNYEFMTSSAYFIFKQDVHKSEKSLLAATCQYLIDNKDKDVGRTGTFISI